MKTAGRQSARPGAAPETMASATLASATLAAKLAAGALDPQALAAAPEARRFSLFDKEEEVLRSAALMLAQLGDIGGTVSDLAEAYRQSYREQERLVRLSDRMQRDLQKAKARLAEQASDLLALNETLAAEIELRGRLELELRSMLETDALTGARSRRHFYDLAASEFTRQQRNGAALSLAILDLDRFKRLNDAHGHEAGDAALRAFAACCQKMIRGFDVFGRLGGEEFGLLLPETGLDEARAAAERICAAIAGLEVPLANGESIRISVSIGFATRAPGETLEQLLRRADRGLYQAKHQGRSRAVADLGADQSPAG
ncbi:GGDEF domain-containing protein [Roseomonas sp. 18066]|uniref:GGDEF domain-containing protein n=1 Tax=Roseomonas sp. 18066 TaxID=2681412 RepID=UPI00190F52B9|nr:GGDEF domain-containing protein [Roseomonas sp. 18066]